MRIAFVGDCVLYNPETHSIGEKLRKKLDNCEIKVVNFEAPIISPLANGIHKSGPVLAQSKESIQWLEKKGFNVFSLANNHTMDYGPEGLLNTIESFDKSSVVLGVGNYETAYKIKIIKKNGRSYGFLGLTHREFGCVDVHSPNDLGTAMLTSPKAIVSIAKAKVDYLYIIAHGGVEYLEAPLPEWRELYKSFIDLGADGVIASHPHVPQGYETYKGRPIFYSLGNFVFEMSESQAISNLWDSSLLVIIDNESNTNEIYHLKYDMNKHVIEICEDKIIDDYFRNVNNILSNPGIYSEFIDKASDNVLPTYKFLMCLAGLTTLPIKERLKNIIRPLLGRKQLKGDKIHFLNLLQCESHKWMMMRLIQNKKL
ncbi:MAG: CapA family protein [Muribaculum sp.]|nr:CapA family protein [Muribaculum sp.]